MILGLLQKKKELGPRFNLLKSHLFLLELKDFTRAGVMTLSQAKTSLFVEWQSSFIDKDGFEWVVRLEYEVFINGFERQQESLQAA